MRTLFLTSSVDGVADHIGRSLTKCGHDIKQLNILFVTTAIEPDAEHADMAWVQSDRQSLVDWGGVVTDYTFSGKTASEIADDLEKVDVLYVSGGNTFYLLQQIQQTACAGAIRAFVDRGGIYIGTSAGSIIAGPDIGPSQRLDKLEAAPLIQGYEGLGLIDIVILPHWGSHAFKDLYLHTRLDVAYSKNHKIILLTDDQYLCIHGERYDIIDARYDAPPEW